MCLFLGMENFEGIDKPTIMASTLPCAEEEIIFGLLKKYKKYLLKLGKKSNIKRNNR